MKVQIDDFAEFGRGLRLSFKTEEVNEETLMEYLCNDKRTGIYKSDSELDYEDYFCIIPSRYAPEVIAPKKGK